MCSPEKAAASLEEKGGMGTAEKGRGKSSLTIIFRYADWLDIVLMLLGTFGAVGDGMSTNCLLVYVSRLFNSLGYGKSSQNQADFLHEIEKVSIYLYRSNIYTNLIFLHIYFFE